VGFQHVQYGQGPALRGNHRVHMIPVIPLAGARGTKQCVSIHSLALGSWKAFAVIKRLFVGWI